MNIEKLTSLPPRSAGYLIDPARPILSMPVEICGAHRVRRHSHPRGQLIYAAEGGVRVLGDFGTWLVPPNQAVWVAPEVEHEVLATRPVRLYCLFVDPSASACLPEACSVVAVSPLLRELIVRAIQVGHEHADEGSYQRLAAVILDQLAELPPAPLHLPLAQDNRLLHVIEALMNNPADRRTLEAWSTEAGASARTLARLFLSETGMTFSQWRRQALLFEAIDRIGRGQSVTAVACDLGYESSSAFIAMFRKTLGISPGRYFKTRR
jgi:AraC-like DNA-binding protein